MAEASPPANAAMASLTGTTVGRFAIGERLGAGGMGEVYRARDLRLKRTVALKRIPPSWRADPKSTSRLWKEAECASRLNNPHIASLYDVFEEGQELFLVMEYVEGQTLRRRLSRPVSIPAFLDIAIQCATALDAAHKAGVVHSDIKPENIMTTPAGSVKVLDFGVAHALPLSDVTTREGAPSTTGIRGTFAYMAPETLQERPADPRADIFSLGVVFYEMLAGHNPFLGASFFDTCEHILHQEAPALRQLNPTVPAEIERIVSKMLAKNPEERYSSAADLAVDLSAAKRALAPSHFRSAAIASLPARRRISRLLPVLAVLLFLIAAAGYWAWRQREARVSDMPRAYPHAIRSIAILPFRNLTGPPEYDYFGVGLADLLNAKLTEARFLEVHSPGIRNSANQSLDPLEAGQRLKVDVVLSGSYQVEGETLSLSYTLVDVRRNVQIAGNAFTYPFTRSIEVEHRLASEIVGSLLASASPAERARFTTAPTQESQAFQAYLQSGYEMEQFWRQPGAERLARAEQDLDVALRLDPGFTLALVSLAKLHWIAAFWGYPNGGKALELAEQEANRAIQQDPSLGEPYAARALVELEKGRLDQARESLREAFLRSPNAALAYYAAGFYYLAQGLPDPTVRAFLRAKELEPDLVRRELGFAYRFQGDLARAEEQERRDLESHPEDLPEEVSLAGILVARGKLAEADQIVRVLLKRAPDDPNVRRVEALLRVREHQPFSIPGWLNRFREAYWSDAGYCLDVAEVLAVAHRNPEALRWLERAQELGTRDYPFLSTDPLFDNLRGDPAFESYLEAVQKEWEAAKQREAQDPLLPAKNSPTAPVGEAAPSFAPTPAA